MAATLVATETSRGTDGGSGKTTSFEDELLESVDSCLHTWFDGT